MVCFGADTYVASILEWRSSRSRGWREPRPGTSQLSAGRARGRRQKGASPSRGGSICRLTAPNTGAVASAATAPGPLLGLLAAVPVDASVAVAEGCCTTVVSLVVHQRFHPWTSSTPSHAHPYAVRGLGRAHGVSWRKCSRHTDHTGLKRPTHPEGTARARAGRNETINRGTYQPRCRIDRDGCWPERAWRRRPWGRRASGQPWGPRRPRLRVAR